ncbi:MAG: phosphotransferase [Pseudomonadota bacterium]
MLTDRIRRRRAEAAARAAWPALARMAGLPEDGQAIEVLRTRGGRGAVRTVLAVRGPGHGGVVLKHVPDETADWYDAQIAAQARAEAAFAGAHGLAVPRMLAADRDRRAWLVERAPGMTAQDAMVLADGAGRLRILRACGRWMGHLHRSGEVQFGRHRPGPILRQLDEWARQLTAGEIDVPDRDGFRDLIGRTRALAEAARGVKVTRTVVHGDMNLRNLIVDGDRIWGIDFGAMRPRPPGTDMARVLVAHGTFFGPVDGDPVDTPEAARAALLEGHAGRWRDSTGLEHLMAAEVLRLWRSIPPGASDRSVTHHRRWAGVRRMAARFPG